MQVCVCYECICDEYVYVCPCGVRVHVHTCIYLSILFGIRKQCILNNKYPVLIIQTLLKGATFDYPVCMHVTTHRLTSRTASSKYSGSGSIGKRKRDMY